MNRAEENNDLYGQSPKGENIMFKKKFIVAGMTAFAITTMTGITALASQEFGNQNISVRNMQSQNFGGQNFGGSFDKGFEEGGNIGQGMMNNGTFDQSNIPSDMPQNKKSTEGFNDFDKGLSDSDNNQSGDRPALGGADNQSGEKPSLGRKSDEEAMKEGNPRPELPEGVTADDTSVVA